MSLALCRDCARETPNAPCRSFNFEGDERWRQYETNIEVPPGRDREAVLQKFKAKWYKREIVGSFQVHYTVCPCYCSDRSNLYSRSNQIQASTRVSKLI